VWLELWVDELCFEVCSLTAKLILRCYPRIFTLLASLRRAFINGFSGVMS